MSRSICIFFLNKNILKKIKSYNSFFFWGNSAKFWFAFLLRIKLLLPKLHFENKGPVFVLKILYDAEHIHPFHFVCCCSWLSENFAVIFTLNDSSWFYVFLYFAFPSLYSLFYCKLISVAFNAMHYCLSYVKQNMTKKFWIVENRMQILIMGEDFIIFFFLCINFAFKWLWVCCFLFYTFKVQEGRKEV